MEEVNDDNLLLLEEGENDSHEVQNDDEVDDDYAKQGSQLDGLHVVGFLVHGAEGEIAGGKENVFDSLQD